jgi:hypothetical protein
MTQNTSGIRLKNAIAGRWRRLIRTLRNAWRFERRVQAQAEATRDIRSIQALEAVGY